MRSTIYRFYVYVYSVNGVPVYVGKGTGDRYKQHLWQCHSKETYWARALRKFLGAGIKPDVAIVRSDLSHAEAIQFECELIRTIGLRLQNTGSLYNMTEGGQGPVGYKFTKEQREKCRVRMIGNNFALGMVHSEESKAKISAAKKGRKESDETKLKKSISLSWQVENQIKYAKLLVSHTWWGPYVVITYEGDIKRQSETATHRLYTVRLGDVITKRTITDFRQGACPNAFVHLRNLYP